MERRGHCSTLLTDGASSQIDPTVARALCGDDAALHVSLCGRLMREFSEFALPVVVEFHDPAAVSGLIGRLHKLRGSAGMVGATSVHRLAGAAEAALAAAHAPTTVETLLQLATAFTALGDEVAPLLAAHSASISPSTDESGAPHVATPESIDRLLKLLDDQNMDVMAHLRAMSPWLKTCIGKVRLLHVQEAVNGLDFSTAAAILRDSLNR